MKQEMPMEGLYNYIIVNQDFFCFVSLRVVCHCEFVSLDVTVLIVTAPQREIFRLSLPRVGSIFS